MRENTFISCFDKQVLCFGMFATLILYKRYSLGSPIHFYAPCEISKISYLYYIECEQVSNLRKQTLIKEKHYPTFQPITPLL
jgi:hypothetical protein